MDPRVKPAGDGPHWIYFIGTRSKTESFSLLLGLRRRFLGLLPSGAP
jgi:hypothetical protein